MKFKALLLLLSLFSIGLLIGQPVDYAIEGKNTMTIKGTSNMHDWESSVEKVNGDVAIAFSEDGWMNIQRLTVWMDVKSLKGSKGSKMDKLTRKALKADAYPRITYSLEKINSIEKTGDGFMINAMGNLIIAGTPKIIDLEVKCKLLPNGAILFESTKALKMTDFNVEPPTALLGVLKTRNEVLISFSITVSKIRL